MRCDANINLKIWENGKEYRTPISEIKNLNSFRSIRDACTYETKRQLKEFETDRQEFVAGFKKTMGWDEVKEETVVQRTKNSFVDYRFVVEPDIKPFTVSKELIEEARSKVGELPEAKRIRLKKEYGLSDFDVQTLTSSRDLALWFEEAAKTSKDPKKAANWILAELLAVLNEKELKITQIEITPAHIAELVNIVHDGVITSKQAKDVFAEMIQTAKMPSAIVKEKNLAATTNTDEIIGYVKQVIAENPKALADLKAGKSNVVGWLMGQVMKKSGGKATPAVATELLKQELAKL